MSDLPQLQLDRIEAKIDRLIAGESPAQEPSDIVGIKEAMRLTGCGSTDSTHRMLKSLGIRPYARGKYLRVQITNAIERRVLVDRIAEQQTEARLPSSRSVNPHDD